MVTLKAKLHVSAGVPDEEHIRKALGPIAEVLAQDGLSIDGGPTLTAASGLEPLFEALKERPQPVFSGRGPNGIEVMVRWNSVVGVHEVPLTGSITVIWPHVEELTGALVSALISVVDELGAPLAVVEAANGPYWLNANLARDTYQEGREGLDRVFGLARGMPGLAWRTIFGPPLVSFFLEERLAALDPDQAMRVGRTWILGLGDDPDTGHERADAEKALRDVLGTERFFDPTNRQLPPIKPQLPEIATYPVTVRRKQGDEFVWEHSNQDQR